MGYPEDGLDIDESTVIAIFELIQAAQRVTSDNKNGAGPEMEVLADLATEVGTHMDKEEMEYERGALFQHPRHDVEAEISVKHKIHEEKTIRLRRNIKKVMSDAVKIVEKYENNKDEAYLGNRMLQQLGMKRDRDAAMDDEIDAKLKEIESLRKRFREAK